ncbi:carboxypeptidase-like regulatory domain-containing protein [Clostridium sp. UBA1056]|uniref:carboxypeptidase-like regulatory domain-containing protein n=1 Tax=unclassified Clostridium TaxID=2614128 RepID=UPI00321665DC
MSVIWGKIINKLGEPVENATICVMDKFFEPLHTTYTDKKGNYKLDVENKEYPYLYAVKDYAVNNLEFWCQDIDLKENIEINAIIDKLEIYALKVFKIDGAYPALMIYFRPMSLANKLQGLTDLLPDIDKFEITINDKKSEVYVVNQVEEFVGNGQKVKSYLLHISIPEEGLKEFNNYLSIQIIDKDGNLGQASTYFILSK